MFAKLLPYFETKFSLASQDLLELHCLHRTWKPKHAFRSLQAVKENKENGKERLLAAHTQAGKLQPPIFNATVNAVSAPPSNLAVQQFMKSSLRAETWHPEPQKEKHRGGKARNTLGLVCSPGGPRRAPTSYTETTTPAERQELPPPSSPHHLQAPGPARPSAGFTSSRWADTSAASQFLPAATAGATASVLGRFGPMAVRCCAGGRQVPRVALATGSRWAPPSGRALGAPTGGAGRVVPGEQLRGRASDRLGVAAAER